MEKKKNLNKENKNQKIGQQEIYDLITSEEISWQSIILDLIRSEQLDPWDIDIKILTESYLKKISELEEANFFISSKVLLAAAILLRMKSYILRDSIKSLDEVLYGKEERRDKEEIISIDEDELPLIIPQTPLPRLRRVTLQDLMSALNRAMATEQRRIKREVMFKRAVRDAEMIIPRKKINIKFKIKEIYHKILRFFKIEKVSKLTFTELIGNKREEKIFSFLPLLHLDTQGKISLNQEKPFSEILIWLKES